MHISVLGSGSSGNSTFIETAESNILVDAGLSARRIKKELASLGKEVHEINAVFITHEHNDHVRGLERLHNKFGVPVFIDKETYLASNLDLKEPQFFKGCINLNDISLEPVPTSHDAANPHGFKVSRKNKTVGYFTDLGKYDNNIKNITKTCDALVLESNHDIDMVINGHYPYHLKERILGEKGHLSNIDAALLVKNHSSEKLKTVFLAHLSHNNNTKELAEITFKQINTSSKLDTILTDRRCRTDFRKI